MTNPRYLVPIVPAGLALFLSSMAAAQTYPIRFLRPWKQGERYRIAAKGSFLQKTSTTVTGGVSGSTLDFTVEFLADATVLEVRRDGRIAKELLTIDNCRVSKEGTSKEVLTKGTVVLAAAENGDEVFRIHGQPVDKEIDDTLSVVITLDAGETSDEDVFGTRENKKLGESWAINSSSAVDWLRQAHLNVNQEDIRGWARVVKRVTVENNDCFVIDGVLATDKLSGDFDGAKIEGGQLQLRITGALPKDISRHPVEQSQQMTIHLLASRTRSPASREAKVDLTTEIRMTAHFTVL
jgi:hypothetical protein